jgi:hypothetical protein
MDSVDQDFDEAVKSFQRELDARQIELFRATPSIQMKRQILKIQHEQETEKRLTDFSRLRRFIDAFEEFDETCTSAQVAVPEISRYIWGPLTYILEVIRRDCIDVTQG